MTPPRRKLPKVTPMQKRHAPPMPDPEREEMLAMSRLMDDPRMTDAERAAARKRAQEMLRRMLARKPKS